MHSANPNFEDTQHSTTVLGVTAGFGHASVVELLLSKGANPDFRDNDGDTPLLLATKNGHASIARATP